MGSVFFSEGTSTVLNRSNTTGSLSEGTKPYPMEVEDTEGNNGEIGTHIFRRKRTLTGGGNVGGLPWWKGTYGDIPHDWPILRRKRTLTGGGNVGGLPWWNGTYGDIPHDWP